MSNSSPTINSLFFFNKEDSAKIIGLLGKYMMKKTLLEVIPNKTTIQMPMEKEPEKSQEAPSIENEFISPTHQDTIFWCIYIAIHGYNDYIQVSRNYGVKELETKQKIGNWIQANPGKMKQTNIKITKAAVQEILSELLTSIKDTSYLTMIGMLIYYNINVIMISANGKTMVEFISNKDIDQPTYVLHKDQYGKYKLQINPINTVQITELKQRLFCLESYLKPLKPISTYQIGHLNEIAMKVGIQFENKKIKKTDIYNEIYSYLEWK
jgi:hypothetical protein